MTAFPVDNGRKSNITAAVRQLTSLMRFASRFPLLWCGPADSRRFGQPLGARWAVEGPLFRDIPPRPRRSSMPPGLLGQAMVRRRRSIHPPVGPEWRSDAGFHAVALWRSLPENIVPGHGPDRPSQDDVLWRVVILSPSAARGTGEAKNPCFRYQRPLPAGIEILRRTEHSSG